MDIENAVEKRSHHSKKTTVDGCKLNKLETPGRMLNWIPAGEIKEALQYKKNRFNVKDVDDRCLSYKATFNKLIYSAKKVYLEINSFVQYLVEGPVV